MTHRSILFTACSALLLTAACDSSSSSDTDANQGVTAASVTYDPASSQLNAAELQGAVDEVVSRLVATQGTATTAAAATLDHSGRLTIVENQVAQHTTDVGANTSAFAALRTDVDALMAQLPPLAADVSIEAITGLDAGNVQGALAVLVAKADALQAALDAQASTIAGLEMQDTTDNARLNALETDLASVDADLESATTCPAGMQRFADTCMDSAAREALPWTLAANACKGIGRVCSSEELKTSCANPSSAESIEWTSSWVDVNQAILTDMTIGNCGKQVGTDVTNDNGVLHPYRCCSHR